MKTNDIYFYTLTKLRKLKVNQLGRVQDFAPNNPSLFVQVVKQLICAGWCEYEFTNDYSAIKRLDLPDFARDYFKKMQMELDEKIVVSENS
ncbi:hypothetical protein [Sphingobacterium multivorum]|uniref:hypothetical protein n=1 Tax=Sphingobacterium multivorum TaxID=28454 RepID=UPI0036998AD8